MKMKKKTLNAITDFVTLLGSAFIIGLVGYGLGYSTADNQPIPVLDVGKICLDKDEMDKTRASDYGDGLRKGQQGCDDFTMNNCVSKFDLISEIGNCGYEASCPAVSECDCVPDFKEGEKEGYKACVRSYKSMQ